MIDASAPIHPSATLTDQGYAALPALLSPGDVAWVTEHVDRLLDGPLPDSCHRPHNTLVPLRWNDPIVTPLLADVDRRLRIAFDIGATDLRWTSGYISVKEPWSPPLWWHQDWWYWQHPVSFAPEAAQVTVACYLTDTTPQTGALRLLPGSHRRSHPVHAMLPEAHSTAATTLDQAHPAFSNQPGQMTPEVRAGDAVVMDYRLLHGTHPNAASGRRDCILLNFSPRWSDLPAAIRGHLISHPALPGPPAEEQPGPDTNGWLPSYSGLRRDLPLSRHPPAVF